MARVKTHQKYIAKDGERLPGVTTVLSILSKPALIHWAWNLGTKGIDFRKFRDDKADIGTLAHYLIMCHLKNEKPNTDDYTKNQIDQAENSVLSFLEWEKSYPLKPILVETPLISEEHRFGGTPDLLTYVPNTDGDTCLVDFKTGKAIYDDYLYQQAAYKILLQENDYEVNNARILNIPRTEDERFEDRRVGNLEYEKGIFLNCLNIYNLKKKIKGDKK